MLESLLKAISTQVFSCEYCELFKNSFFDRTPPMTVFKCNCGSQCTKKKFSIKDFFRQCDQISSFLRIWSHLLKKSIMGNFNLLRSELNTPINPLMPGGDLFMDTRH